MAANVRSPAMCFVPRARSMSIDGAESEEDAHELSFYALRSERIAPSPHVRRSSSLLSLLMPCSCVSGPCITHVPTYRCARCAYTEAVAFSFPQTPCQRHAARALPVRGIDNQQHKVCILNLLCRTCIRTSYGDDVPLPPLPLGMPCGVAVTLLTGSHAPTVDTPPLATASKIHAPVA
jgi:hypothetical protein